MIGRFLPKETGFFDYFEKHAQLCVAAARELLSMAGSSGNITPHVERIRSLEQEADKITHQCMDALHQTFITPIDRSHIHDLIKRLDDILDALDAATSRMALYDMTTLTPQFRSFAEVLVKACEEIEGAIKLLRNLKQIKDIESHCVQVHHLENQGDDILRAALGQLFREEKNAIEVIKWKEIYERLEKATDRCESVVNVIQGVLIEAS